MHYLKCSKCNSGYFQGTSSIICDWYYIYKKALSDISSDIGSNLSQM